MSAFIVTNEHISAMMQAAEGIYPDDEASYWWGEERHYFRADSQEIGQILLNENFRSVNCRYDEDYPPDTYAYCPIRAYSAAEILKACACYEYQSCETDDWEETEAYAIAQALEGRAICMIPGYEGAEWSIMA